MTENGKWQFWIDRGGTFTDIVARRPDGNVVTHKLLSENPRRYEDAAIHGMREVLQLGVDESLPSDRIGAVLMGTTVSTNALLEHSGEGTLLAITRGFRDQLRIGNQTRPDLFALDIRLPESLYCDILEVDERIRADGEAIIPLDEDKAREGLLHHYERGLRSVAIVLLHAYRYHEHENRLAELAREVGFTQVSTSHEVSPLMKLVPRGDTTVVDAYVSPGLRKYVDYVAAHLEGLRDSGGRLMFMRSSGGLVDARYFQGKDAILSGPAGGVVGMARVCEQAGYSRVIGFDMGGTSTDVSLYDGDFEKTFDAEVAGVSIRAPMMLIHTVAAGGGSVLHFDGSRFRVGPDSAGAAPGPMSYRDGGPLTITDCNVMLGRLQPDFFPAVFGPQSNQALDRDSVVASFGDLADSVSRNTGEKRTPEAVATGFLRIAVENMANAIKKISIQRGYDASQFALCCFGGAGGQHACLVADALGMEKIIVHPLAGVLSAFGMGLADTIVDRQKTIEANLEADLLKELRSVYEELISDAKQELARYAVDSTEAAVKRVTHIRYEGSDTALEVPYSTLEDMEERFEEMHRSRFGFVSTGKAMVVESIAVEVVSAADTPATISPDSEHRSTPGAEDTRRCYMGDEWHAAPFYRRKSLNPGVRINGPAVILDPTSTIVVEPGWRATLDGSDNLVLERYLARPDSEIVGTSVDPVMLEIFNNLFMSIAEQMGTVLENTASSVNIKERLDFSCAVFDAHGGLVANAPHLPVHLGSMSESIKTVLRENRNDMGPGDAFVLNAPYNGGTHLPDITVVKPVFNSGGNLTFFVAARGHHADIGGKVPGSAPADSTTIEEEGVVIDNFKLVADNEFRERELLRLLTSGPWPARKPSVNIGDLKAQLAACEKGSRELHAMLEYYGEETVNAYMQHVQDYAEECVRRVLETLQDGQFSYEMDDGNNVSVRIHVDRERRAATIDFTGTSPQHKGNFNAPKSVVTAAVLYVMRCLVKDKIPLNVGCLAPIEMIIPEHSMINPEYPGAVFAGNVETSQCIVDALFGALGVVAASQGTMNNFVWGNEDYQYYETICGGTGATPDHDGADAVHSHMTNSKLTDPEVLEWRFPVLVESFEIRAGSGGRGRHRGGNGVVRKIRFREAMTANIISGHRRIPPFGVAGGECGRVGRNYIVHPDGSSTNVPGVAGMQLKPDDVFVIETPGGGGFGPAQTRN